MPSVLAALLSSSVMVPVFICVDVGWLVDLIQTTWIQAQPMWLYTILLKADVGLALAVGCEGVRLFSVLWLKAGRTAIWRTAVLTKARIRAMRLDLTILIITRGQFPRLQRTILIKTYVSHTPRVITVIEMVAAWLDIVAFGVIAGERVVFAT